VFIDKEPLWRVALCDRCASSWPESLARAGSLDSCKGSTDCDECVGSVLGMEENCWWKLSPMPVPAFQGLSGRECRSGLFGMMLLIVGPAVARRRRYGSDVSNRESGEGRSRGLETNQILCELSVSPVLEERHNIKHIDASSRPAWMRLILSDKRKTSAKKWELKHVSA